MENLSKFETLVQIMKKLRGKDGCPWDKEQTLETLREYIIEETYEVIEAITGDNENLKEELGDLLLQVIFCSEIESEKGHFDINDVIREISEKLIRRHPHVFGDKENVNTAQDVVSVWDAAKEKEKKDKDKPMSILGGIPKSFPPILRAYKLQEKAAKIGFDWDNPLDALKKLKEEIMELEEEIKNSNKKNIEEELGDIIFAAINVARLYNVHPNIALEKTNKKFFKRFFYIEKNINVRNATLKEMEKLWEEAKNED